MRRTALTVLVVCSLVLGKVVAMEDFGTSEAGHDDIPVLQCEDGDGVSGDPDDSGTRKISFGETVALEELGPIIVNEDCTMRRITNLEGMTERERRGVQRRVAERNKERLERCNDEHGAREDL